MIDWELPLFQIGGDQVVLVAMLNEHRSLIQLSAGYIDDDTKNHFRRTYDEGVRFMVHKYRESSKPIYYKEDGSPWLSHHPKLRNGAGKAVRLDERAADVRAKIKQDNIEREKRRERALREDRAKQALNEKAHMEDNPLWGQF